MMEMGEYGFCPMSASKFAFSPRGLDILGVCHWYLLQVMLKLVEIEVPCIPSEVWMKSYVHWFH